MACESNCEPPSWDDFQFHISICGSVWLALTLLGVVLGTCKHSWEAERVEKLLRGTADFLVSKWYMITAVVLAVVMCMLHVVRTEFGDPPSMWDTLEMAWCFCQVAETFTLWLRATAKSNDDFQDLAFGRLPVDCVLTASVIIRGLSGSQQSNFSFSYVASLRLLWLWRTFRASLPSFKQGVRTQLANAMITLSSGIFCLAALIGQVETLQGEEWDIVGAAAPAAGTEASVRDTWTLSSSVYFVLATITTVGYADMAPKTALAQVLAVVVTVLGVWVLLRALLGAIQALESGSGGSGRYGGMQHAKHIVVTGSPSFQVLRDFLEEIYHEDHAHAAEDLNVVILLMPGQTSVMVSMQNFLGQKSNQELRRHVWLVQGSALKCEDLNRVDYKHASAAFLLPNLYAADAEKEDMSNVMRALSMQQHTPYVRRIALLVKGDHRDMMLSIGATMSDVVCADELKNALLGKSCEVLGFATLASILFKSTSSSFHTDNADNAPPWEEHYLQGLANELWEVDLSPAYRGAPFGKVAVDVLSRSSGAAYLIGVEEEPLYPSDKIITKMFPGRNYKISTSDDRHSKGIFIAKNREDILQHTPYKTFAYNLDHDVQAGATAPGAVAMCLPNVVPETLAGALRTGWVRESRDVEADQKEKVLQAVQKRATRRVVKGMRQRTGLPLKQIEDMLGPLVGGAGSMLADAEEADDPGSQAIRQREDKAQRAEEDEEEAEIEAANENRLMAKARRAVVSAGMVADARSAEVQQNRRDQEEDNELWGAPPPTAPRLWGDPREPPPELLLRGGHVLLLALEGDVGGVTGAASDDEGAGVAVVPGKKLGLGHFIRSLRASSSRRKRPVVVVAARVPHDWAKCMSDSSVYFLHGHPLSASNLQRAGLAQAHVVVIHQRAVAAGRSSSTADSEAIFACRLAEAVAAAAGKDIAVICDLMLEKNAGFVPLVPREKGKVLQTPAVPRDDDDETEKKLDLAGTTVPFYMQPRFICGQLFVSNVATAMTANMMYNNSLALVLQELIRTSYVIVPVPDDWHGHVYADLFEFLIRWKNLLPLALVRRMDIDPSLDDEDLPDAPAAGAGPAGLGPAGQGNAGLGKAAPPVERWSPDDPPSRRYIFVMPSGQSRVAEHDGVMCMLPSAGRAVLPRRPMDQGASVSQQGSALKHQRQHHPSKGAGGRRGKL